MTEFTGPIRSRLLISAWARAGSYSLLTSTPCPFSAAASWLLLPPGAAHMSSTRWPGRTSSSAAGALAEGSCR